MKLFTFLFSAIISFSAATTSAQIKSNIQTPTSINEDGADPDESALLDIKSSTKGLLIPRMTNAQIEAIANPVPGLMVFDQDEKAFYFFNGEKWAKIGDGVDDNDADPNNELLTNGLLNGTDLELSEGGQTVTVDLSGLDEDDTPPTLADNDNDTKIQVEKFPDDDEIRFDLEGEEKITFVQNANGDAMISFPANSGNVFVGLGAGLSNTYGSSLQANTFIGIHAGKDNTIGFSNTMIGAKTGFSNSTGYANTFIGLEAGYSNTTANENTFIGRSAGYSNTTGFRNTFIGETAGHGNTTGELNTFVGEKAGLNNSTGNFNTFLGETAGFNNISGSTNTFIGHGAGHENTNGGDNVFIGQSAGYNETGSDKLYISNSSTIFPLIYGEFDNQLLRINGTLRVGEKSIADMGTNNLGIGADIIPFDASSYDIGNNAVDESWDDIVADDFINVSDGRTKRNVKEIGYGLAAISQLRPVSYQYLHEPEFAPHSLGLIAQEVLPIIPEVVKTHEIDADENGQWQKTPVDIMGINYVELVPLLIKGMQEQQLIIETQQKKIEAQRKEIAGQNTLISQQSMDLKKIIDALQKAGITID